MGAGRVAVVAVLAMIGAGCGASAGPGSPAVAGGTDVVVTTSIWADVVANVACDGALDIDTLVPPGADPHAFEPSLQDRATMESAALVVANGLGLEEGLEDTIDAVAAAGTPVFRFADHLDPIGADPHVWFDPTRVSAALPALAAQLVAEAGLDPAAVEACLADYQAELEALDAEIVELLSPIPPAARLLVTNHDSLGYFADRYDLRVVGTVIPAPSTLAETSPGQLRELADLIEREGVRTIFADVEHSSDDAEALADLVGDVEVATLLTGGLGEPGSGADTYVGLLRTDARAIADGVG